MRLTRWFGLARIETNKSFLVLFSKKNCFLMSAASGDALGSANGGATKG
jgi:hypothetical protein